MDPMRFQMAKQLTELPPPPTLEPLPSGRIEIRWLPTVNTGLGQELACEVHAAGDNGLQVRWERVWPEARTDSRLIAIWPDDFRSDPPGHPVRAGNFDVWWLVRSEAWRPSRESPMAHRFRSLHASVPMTYDPPRVERT